MWNPLYLLYSWKFPWAGLRMQPKKETTSLFTSICLPLKVWLSSPRNQSRSGEVCSGLLPQMLRGSVIRSLLFCESHFYICLTFIPQAVCVPMWVCSLLQVTTIFLLTATFISNHTDKLEVSSFPLHTEAHSCPFSHFIFCLHPAAYCCYDPDDLLPSLCTYPLRPILYSL